MVGGKTGTSDKVVGGRYSKDRVLTTFTAVLPADDPRYLILIMLDEPQATPETHGFHTSGWNACADRRGGHLPGRPLARPAAALRPAAGRPVDPRGVDGEPVK